MRPGRTGDLASLAETSFTFIAPRGFQHSKTRAHVRLLGPCFKTGRMDPYDRQHPKRMVRDHHPNDRQQSRSTASSPPHSTTGRRDGTLALREACAAPPRSGPSREENRAVTDRATPKGRTDLPSRHLSDPVPTDVDARPREVRRPGAPSPGPRSIQIRKPRAGTTRRLNLKRRIAESIRFPSNGFTYFLTLFSKFFSSFPHGTCSLSVSRQYLALDGVYHPFWAAFPNNPTLRKHIVSGRPRHRRGCHPLRRAVPSNLGTVGPPRKCFSQLQLAEAFRPRRFQI